MVRADAAGGDDHRLRLERELPDRDARAWRATLYSARLKHIALHAVYDATCDGECVHPIAKLKSDKATFRCLTHPPHERRDHPRPSSPGDMEAWNRIARTNRAVAATLSPANNRKEAKALLSQPGALLTGGEGDIGLCPLAAPYVLVVLAVEPSVAQPILQRQLIRVVDAHAPLLWRVHQE